MNYEIIKQIILFSIILGITFYLLKSFIQAIVITFIIVILFRIGWVYTSDDLRSKFSLEKIIPSKYVESIYDKYDDYVNKREEYKIINPDELEGAIKKELQEKVNQYLKKDDTIEDNVPIEGDSVKEDG